MASSDEGTLVRCAADARPHAERYRNDEFAELFDGSERVISVHAVPTSLRGVCAA